MQYIAEFWSESEVWLVSNNGQLISIHTSLPDAQHECLKLHKSHATVIDRSGGLLPELTAEVQAP